MKKKGQTGISFATELKKLTSHPTLSAKETFGQKSADALTKWAGSWVFIILFFVLIILWISANIYAWISQWDPYPFILLNLALSLLAAIQAPVILMSQNREAQKDRIRSEYDYAVNRRAEREINEIQNQLDRIEKKLLKR
ncbi:hypothetical protein AUJ84_01255 [Candidatus Pacearchaeota archaeon CG1_02_32_132]|nr:MAG: hypothetical protein AUJ84_01255 [Candidatus Pacearchaeota archaeon CG1_02_32_132]